MNIVFWVAVVLALIAVWFGLAITFRAIGGFFKEIFKDTMDIINDKEDEE